MTTLLFANNAGSTLAGAITNVSTTLNLASGGGSLFPNPSAGQSFLVTAVDASTGLLREIMSCTARSGDTLTVVRAQEGTTALNWNPGDLIQNLVTAGTLAQMLQQGQAPASIVYYGTDTGGVNTLVSTVAPALGSLVDGVISAVAVLHANTIAGVTFNNSGTGALNVKRSDGTALLPGDLQGPPYVGLLIYNAANTEYLLLNPATWVSQPPPTKLSGNLTLYVSTTGSDSNNGLTIGAPFLTIQHAWNVLVGNYNLNGFTATIQLADGTYGAGLVASTMPGGVTSVTAITINGNSGTPANVIINASGSGACLEAIGPCGFVAQNMKLQSAANGNLLAANNSGFIQFQNIVFGATTANHIATAYAGSVIAIGNYSIVGGAASHWSATGGGTITVQNNTLTITGTPAFSFAFAAGGTTGSITVTGETFSGAATGIRYVVDGNAVIYTNGSGATYFPGNAGGTTSHGGQYI